MDWRRVFRTFVPVTTVNAVCRIRVGQLLGRVTAGITRTWPFCRGIIRVEVEILVS